MSWSRRKKAAGVEVGLFGIDLGDFAKGDRGFPNIPDYREWWRGRADEAFRLAERLDTRLVNVIAGNIDPRYSRQEMMDCLYENLAWAIPRAREAGTCLIIEPLNHFDSPRYLLEQTGEVVEVIEHFNSPDLQLQLDLYHVQRSHGNVVQEIQKYFPHIRHIQVADSPDRHQPVTGAGSTGSLFWGRAGKRWVTPDMWASRTSRCRIRWTHWHGCRATSGGRAGRMSGVVVTGSSHTNLSPG